MQEISISLRTVASMGKKLKITVRLFNRVINTDNDESIRLMLPTLTVANSHKRANDMP